MANIAVSVTQALNRHAVRLLGFADLKMLLVVEDPNGNRIWSANGKLRNEFINEGKIENRAWGMIELESVEGMEAEEETAALGALKENHRDSSLQRDSAENIDRSSSLERGVEKEVSTKPRDLPSKYFDWKGERKSASLDIDRPQMIPPPRDENFVSGSMAGSGLPQSATCMHCGKPHASLDCPLVNPCAGCGEWGHEIVNCMNAAPVADAISAMVAVDKAFCVRCGLTGHILQYCLATSCFKCGRTDHLAPQCGGESVEMALGQNGMSGGMPNTNGCSKCGGRDHDSLNCVLCFKCKRYGHMAPKCPNCFVCSRPGHDASKCPACPLCLLTDHKVADCPKNSTGINSGVICHKCFNVGHKASECVGVICHKCGELGHKSPQCTKDTTCHKCKKVGHKAPDCPELSRMICHQCGEPGHKSPECTKDPICHKCKKVGHKAPDCPELSRMICHKCGEPGHKSPECTKDTICQKCNSVGHKAPDCPGSSRMICHKCKAVGHKTPDCPQNMCINCYAKGHLATKCPVIICRTCKGAGHKAAECPGNVECSNCGQKGHASADCVPCTKCHAPGHKTENCPAKTCHKCGVVGHIAPDCPQNAKSNTPKMETAKPINPKLSSSCPECGRVGHTITTCPIFIIKKMKSNRDSESSSRQMGASNNDSDDDIEIVDELGGAGEKGSSGSQKELSDKMDMRLAAMLQYKDRGRLHDRLMGLCATKIRTGDKGNYTEIYDLLKDLIDSADKMEIPMELVGSCRTFRGKLKSRLQKIRVDSWQKGNVGVGLFIHSELTSLIPKSQLPRDHLGKSVKNSSAPSPAKPEARPEARASETGGNQVTLESLLNRSNMKDQKEAVLRLMKTCHIRSEGNDSGGYLAIFDLFKEAISLLKPSKVDSDIRPACVIFTQKLENLKKVANDNAAKKRMSLEFISNGPPPPKTGLKMNGVTKMLVTSLSKHAHRLIDIANMQVMVFMETVDGERFWSGNGKLRHEFVNTGKLSNRSSGMFEVEGDNIRPAPYKTAPPSPARSVSDVSDASLSPPPPSPPPPAALPPPPPKSGIPKREKTSKSSSADLCKDCDSLKFSCIKHRCLECGQLGHKTTECPRRRDDNAVETIHAEDQESSSRSFACSVCNKLGHVSDDCPEKAAVAVAAFAAKVSRNRRIPTCDYCRKPGHKFSGCRDFPAGATFCHHCCQIGHMYKNCNERKKDIQAGLVSVDHCDFCKVAGHDVKQCTYVPTHLVRCYCCLKVGHMVSGCPVHNKYKYRDEDRPLVPRDSADNFISDCPAPVTSDYPAPVTSDYPIPATSEYPSLKTSLEEAQDGPGDDSEFALPHPLPSAGSNLSDILSIPTCSCCQLLGHVALDCPLNDGKGGMVDLNDGEGGVVDLGGEYDDHLGVRSMEQGVGVDEQEDGSETPKPQGKSKRKRKKKPKVPQPDSRDSTVHWSQGESRQGADLRDESRRGADSRDESRPGADSRDESRRGADSWDEYRRGADSQERRSPLSKDVRSKDGRSRSRDRKSSNSRDLKSTQSRDRNIRPESTRPAVGKANQSGDQKNDHPEERKTNQPGDRKTNQPGDHKTKSPHSSDLTSSSASSEQISKLLGPKSLPSCLQSLTQRGKIRFTWIEDEEVYLISILEGDNFDDSLRKITSKKELKEALLEAGVTL